jgi:FolB domain-containing protein
VNFFYTWGILKVEITVEGAMDKVIIKNILARGIIGIHEWEREKPQDILINIELSTMNRQPESPDDIECCVDYSKVTKRVIYVAESAKRYTLEALAEDIAQVCLEDIRVVKTTVRVEKPGAVRFSESVGVEIERSQNIS